MLLDFTVGNFGPFRDDATLSMNATTVSEHPENLLNRDAAGKDLLSSAIVFGPNAAGKSYFLNAVLFLKRIVKTVDGNISPSLYMPYRLTKAGRESPVRMRIRLILDGILYDYSINYMSGTVVSESLYHYPKNRRAKVFVRTGPSEFTDAKKSIITMISPGKTYLAMASVGADKICSIVRNAIIRDLIFIGVNIDSMATKACRFADKDSGRRMMMIRALGTADLGINDFSYEEERIPLNEVKNKIPPEVYEDIHEKTDTLSKMKISLRHEYRNPDIGEEDSIFPIELESVGTKFMFGLMGPMIDSLEKGKVMFIDDLGVHLHPMLTRWLVKLFSRENNPNGAQLVANTHDIGLMDIDGLLRRDQIWFVNKSREDGSSELYCLSDFEGVRKDTDVMRRYLDGRFDAVPAVRHRGVIE